MIDWKPIETIPPEMKDGREVLIYDPSNEDHYFIARWEDPPQQAIKPELYGWVSGFYDCEQYPEPTYWAELDPPSDQDT